MAKNKKKKHYSGIGGQAVLEGIMMKNAEQYSVGVRKPDGTIEVDVDNYQGVSHGSSIRKVPFIRGVINFVDSLILGMKSLNFSAEFYIDEDEKTDEPKDHDAEEKKKAKDRSMTFLIGAISVVLALGLFMVLPVYLTNLFAKDVRNDSLVAIIEGGIRLAIFLIYIVAISLMQDIKRTYMYHGAEHKCINCIERGRPLSVANVMRSSRFHKRCGTSFLLFVVMISIIVFFFIRVDNMAFKVLIRIALIPVIAGISYEILSFAGKHDNILTTILSGPGLLLQRLTTKEPDEDMVEVAIAAVEAVFDWRKFLLEDFGYDYTEWTPDKASVDEQTSDMSATVAEDASESEAVTDAQADSESATDTDSEE